MRVSLTPEIDNVVDQLRIVLRYFDHGLPLSRAPCARVCVYLDP
jgi:hypothetical protein